MLNEFKQYLLGIGKSENTALNYCDKVKLYFKWCLDSFGSEPQQLYSNVLRSVWAVRSNPCRPFSVPK